MSRIAIVVVSFMGSLGFALGIGYILLIGRAFGRGSESVTWFLVGESDANLGWGFLLFLVPYALLLAHLYLRIRVGSWLLSRGEVELAERYASRRMKPNLLRARKEALAHRNVVARILIRRGEYDGAWNLMEDAEPGRPSPWAVERRRWQLETALRRENLLDAHTIVEAAGTVRSRGGEVAAYLACVAEIAIREGKPAEARERLDAARWALSAPHPRVAFVRGLHAAKFTKDEETTRDGLGLIEQAKPWLGDVPGAEGEWRAVKALLLAREGDAAAARQALGEFSESWDRRSRFAWEEARDEIEG